MNPKARSGVYAITAPNLHHNIDALLAACEAAMKGGIGWLQYRHKDVTPEEKHAIAIKLQALAEKYQVPLIINDDMQLAHQVGAAGVHLGQDDGSPAAARALLGPKAIIGVTCHQDLSLAKQAIEDGANYVAFGRFFASTTKPQAPPASLEVLSSARQVFDNATIVAIGGINEVNAQQAIQAGAHMIAVAHSLFAAADISAQARNLVALTQT